MNKTAMGQNPIYTGVVKYVPPEKYYGFIARDDKFGDIFVHFTDVKSSNGQLKKGDLVTFEIEQTPKGLKAINVNLVTKTNGNNSKSLDEETIAYIQKLKSVFKEASKREFNFLLLGRTGVGKSSTVNALIGENIAEVGDFTATTFQVKPYKSQIQGINYSIIDTPGLCDNRPEKHQDELYLKEIKKRILSIDCVWFTTPLNETRLRSDELYGIKVITKVFGKEIWDRSIIVFTFADLIPPEKYFFTLQQRTNLIVSAIQEYSGEAIAKQIPSVGVSNITDRTPNGELWLGELYTKVFVRISKKGALPFLLATSNRLKETNPEQEIIEKKNKYLDSKSINQECKNASVKKLQKLNDDFLPHGKTEDIGTEKYKHKNKSSPSSAIVLTENQQLEIKTHIQNDLANEIDPVIISNLANIGTLVGLSSGNIVGAVAGAVIGAAIGFTIWIFGKKRKGKQN